MERIWIKADWRAKWHVATPSGTSSACNGFGMIGAIRRQGAAPTSNICARCAAAIAKGKF